MNNCNAIFELFHLSEWLDNHIPPTSRRKDLKEAINLGISALKTIEDGDYIMRNTMRRHATYGMNRFMQIDIKTLYEQMTMYCDLVGETKDGDRLIFEKYHQLDTPIDVDVHWDNNHVVKMTFEIREGKGI